MAGGAARVQFLKPNMHAAVQHFKFFLQCSKTFFAVAKKSMPYAGEGWA
jgi:hypothetical protein